MRTPPRGVVITGGEAVQSEYRPVQLLILVLIDSLSMTEVHLLSGKRGGMTVPTGEPESEDWKGQTNCGTSLPRPQFPR